MHGTNRMTNMRPPHRTAMQERAEHLHPSTQRQSVRNLAVIESFEDRLDGLTKEIRRGGAS